MDRYPEEMNNILWGSPDRQADRGMAQLSFNNTTDSMSDPVMGKSTASSASDLDFSLPCSHQSDLIHHAVCEGSEDRAVYEEVVNYVRSQYGNEKVDPRSKTVIGYIFDETRFAKYIIQMYKEKDNIGVRCDLMDGFALCLQPFWKGLEQSLCDSGMLQKEMEEEDISMDDLSFLWSDEEDSMDLVAPPLDLNACKFLQLEEDVACLDNMIEDLQDPNFLQDTILLLSHNCQESSNLELIAQKPQEFFNAAIQACIISQMTLPVVRCAMVFIDHLCRAAQVSVSEETVQLLLDQLAQWSGVHVTKTTEVTESSEIATLLSKNLPNLCPRPLDSNLLAQIADTTTFKTVERNVRKYLQARV